MMDVSVIGLAELHARLLAMPASIGAALSAKTQTLSDALAEKVRDKLSGSVLNAKSGILRDSIQVQENDALGGVYVDGNIPYAAIQEYGGTTKGYIIESINAKTLAFIWQGREAFYKSVFHPGSVIPERSYLRSSLYEMNDEITQEFNDAIGEVFDT